MSAARGSREDVRAGVGPAEVDVEVEVDAEGGLTITLDRTHSMLVAVRDAHRAPPLPVADDDPRHEVFERELRILLGMARQDGLPTEDSLLIRRNELLDRIGTATDVEPLFDELIDTITTARTVDACVQARFEIQLLGVVMSVYRPDIFTNGALEIGRHFYGRAERQLVAEGAFTDVELQRAL